jgi:hypothetical protein
MAEQNAKRNRQAALTELRSAARRLDIVARVDAQVLSKRSVIRKLIRLLDVAWENFEAAQEGCMMELVTNEEFEEMLAEYGEMYQMFGVASEVGWVALDNLEPEDAEQNHTEADGAVVLNLEMEAGEQIPIEVGGAFSYDLINLEPEDAELNYTKPEVAQQLDGGTPGNFWRPWTGATNIKQGSPEVEQQDDSGFGAELVVADQSYTKPEVVAKLDGESELQETEARRRLTFPEAKDIYGNKVKKLEEQDAGVQYLDKGSTDEVEANFNGPGEHRADFNSLYDSGIEDKVGYEKEQHFDKEVRLLRGGDGQPTLGGGAGGESPHLELEEEHKLDAHSGADSRTWEPGGLGMCTKAEMLCDYGKAWSIEGDYETRSIMCDYEEALEF